MKNKFLLLLLILTSALSCSKEPTLNPNAQYIRYFNAWLRENGYDACPRTPLGAYIIKDIPGTGALVDSVGTDSLYVFTDHVEWDLDGQILSTTTESFSRLLGAYDTTNFYGPRVRRLIAGAEYAGVKDALAGSGGVGGMRYGGERTVVIPGWLMTYNNYPTAAAYESSVTGEARIFSLKPVSGVRNIRVWEVDSLCRFVTRFFGGSVNPADTVDSKNNTYGFYYVRTGEPSVQRSMLRDTVIYINYTCYLTDGRVVDTSVKRIAQDAGFNVSAKSYGPVQMNMSEDYRSITMGSEKSTLIKGFTLALSKMNPHEKGTAVFYSAWGYGHSGSGNRIPPYAPLRFELEVVDKPTS